MAIKDSNMHNLTKKIENELKFINPKILVDNPDINIIQRSIHKSDISQFMQNMPNIYLIKYLPVQISKLYLHIQGYIYYLFHRNEHIKVKLNVEKILGNYSKLNRVMKKRIGSIYSGIFEHYHEKLLTAYKRIEWLKFFYFKNIFMDQKLFLKNIYNQGKGIIFVSAHYGAVEYIPTFLTFLGFPVTVIMRFKTQKLKQHILKRIENYNVEILDAADSNISIKIIKALKANRILFTMCDEFEMWRVDKNKKIKLFQQDVNLDRTIDIIQRRTNSVIIFGLLERMYDGRYKMILKKINKAKNKNYTEQILNILETTVLNHPDQWYQWGNVSNIFSGK